MGCCRSWRASRCCSCRRPALPVPSALRARREPGGFGTQDPGRAVQDPRTWGPLLPCGGTFPFSGLPSIDLRSGGLSSSHRPSPKPPAQPSSPPQRIAAKPQGIPRRWACPRWSPHGHPGTHGTFVPSIPPPPAPPLHCGSRLSVAVTRPKRSISVGALSGTVHIANH